MQDVLSEICNMWSTRWDEYVAPACWIKRTRSMPDPSFPSAMTPFQLLFGRSPRIALHVKVPQTGDTETTRGLTNFIENRPHRMGEAMEALTMMHESRVKTREHRNADIRRPWSGVRPVEGDLVLARESESSLFRQAMRPTLVPEKWTGPWKVVKGSSAIIETEGRKTRTRTVSMVSHKPFSRRSSDLRHPIEDDFAQIVWIADFGLRGDSIAAAPMYTLMDRRTMDSVSGVARWEYRGKYLDGASSDWATESESLDSFTPLQLDTFHAL